MPRIQSKEVEHSAEQSSANPGEMNGEEILIDIQITLIMKEKLLWIIVYSLCIASCTTDTTTQNSDGENRNLKNELVIKNSTGTYKEKRYQYYEIINSYRNKDGFPQTVEELTLQIQAIETTINKEMVNDNDILAINVVVSDILKDPKGQLQKIIREQNINIAVQESLLQLINVLLETSAHKQINLRDSMTAYELKVIQNEALDEEDKKAVLSLVYISQFLVSTESERKDRDWEKAVTNKKVQNLVEQRQVSIVTFIALINSLISSS